ncbi:MAG TPA: ArsA-related P-loop ATPase [Solirubrobacteraceae bacterium]|jgi:anion-transporting  ArsA/GET3 family ATPase|nr:ArsA-related P-loop ATPase [Solirubrobacteraceae bacterium]
MLTAGSNGWFDGLSTPVYSQEQGGFLLHNYDPGMTAPSHKPLAERLAGKRVCICAGPGGVGKTTSAAAIALGLARRGQKVAVLTIDPAKRLAEALGLDALQGEPRLVDPATLAAQGIELKPGGELWAMTLDVKRTFDALVDQFAADERAREEVMANRIYQELSTAVAGSQEFTAVSRLYELEREGRFDVIVLDTPPSRNALDFLDAPGRLSQFFEGRALRVFLAPGGLAARFLGRGTGLVLAMFSRVTGIDLMGDISTFFRSLGGITEGIIERARGTSVLLRAAPTLFLVITSPEPEPAREASYLAGKLDQADMRRGGLIVNRVHLEGLQGHDVEHVRTLLSEQLDSGLAARLAGNLADFDVLARRDRESVAALSHTLLDKDPIVVPHLNGDVDLRGLAEIERHLFA